MLPDRYKIAARAERELPTNTIVPRLKEEAKVWKDLVPACGELKNPALQDRHWDKLEGLVGFKFERDPETWSEPFTLGSLMSKSIMNFRSVLVLFVMFQYAFADSCMHAANFLHVLNSLDWTVYT